MRMDIFKTEEKINLKEEITKRGYSNDLFYLGQTEKMASDYYIYSLSKTTALVGEDEIFIIGEDEDIKPAKKCLETKLNVKLLGSNSTTISTLIRLIRLYNNKVRRKNDKGKGM